MPRGWRGRWRRGRRALAQPGGGPLRAVVVVVIAIAALVAIAAVAGLPLALRARYLARSDELEGALEGAGAAASRAFRDEARRELARAAHHADEIERDLSTPLAGVEVWQGDARVLPPEARCVEPEAAPEELAALSRRVVEAANGRDPRAVEAAVRAWLAYRANERHAPATDLRASLEPLEALAGSGVVEPALLRALLVDGLASGASRVPALLQQALWALPGACDEELASRTARLLLGNGVGGARLLETTGAWRSLPREAPPTAPGAWVRGDAMFAEVREDGRALVVRTEEPARAARLAVAASGVTSEIGGPSAATWTRLEHVELRALTLAELRAGRARFDLAVRTATLATALLASAGVLLLAIDRRRRRQMASLRRDLIASVAHELRTPLASMRLQADALHRWVQDERARSTLARLHTDVDVLESMVENVLCYGRIARGGVVLRERPVSLVELCREVLERAQLEQPGLQVALAGGDATVLADAELVQLVVANLVRNAWRHNPRPERSVRVGIEREGDDVRVRVSDNGPGIDAAEQARVFRPFERSLTLARGSGLGLTLSREIARLHGGDVRLAESGPQGSTFVLELPA